MLKLSRRPLEESAIQDLATSHTATLTGSPRSRPESSSDMAKLRAGPLQYDITMFTEIMLQV